MVNHADSSAYQTLGHQRVAFGRPVLFLASQVPGIMTPQDDEKREQLRQQLNDTHTWPCVFGFKFIVPAKPENEASLRAIFGTKAAFQVRESSRGITVQ